MKKTSYRDLHTSEEKFNTFLLKLGIPINNNDRIHQAYQIVRELDQSYKIPEEYALFREKYDLDTIRFSMHDLQLIYDVIDILENENPLIVKSKLTHILSGTLGHLETVNDSNSRNYLFEILFLKYLKEANINANLCDPNPDILATVEDRNYHIQCKRLFSNNKFTVKRNLARAFKQLDVIEFSTTNDFGIITLSVEPGYTSGNLTLLADSEESALKQLDAILYNFYIANKRLWINKKNKKIVAIFLHIVALVTIKDQVIQSVGSFLAIAPSHEPQTQDFIQLTKDFGNLKK